MKIGYAQTSPVFADKEKNFAQVRELLRGVAADLIVLPELFATGYTFISRQEALGLAEKAHGETAAFLGELARETGSAIAAGFIEREDDQIYNAALLVSPQQLLGTYRKIHLFNKEKLWFSPGNKPLKVYELGGARVGMMICFDWIFPETARTLALLGADIIAHAANLVLPYCPKAMTTRCLENRLFALTCNRIGSEARGEDRFAFTGGSQITGCNGEVIACAPADRIQADFAEIDPLKARDKKLNAFNDLLGDRRRGFYAL